MPADRVKKKEQVPEDKNNREPDPHCKLTPRPE